MKYLIDILKRHVSRNVIHCMYNINTKQITDLIELKKKELSSVIFHD